MHKKSTPKFEMNWLAKNGDHKHKNILPITSIIMDHPTGKTSIWNRNVNFVLQVVVIQIDKWMEEKSLSPTYIVQMEVKHLQILWTSMEYT